MTTLHDFAQWLIHSPLNAAVTSHAWIVPALQVDHILGIAAVVVSAALINLRALGVMETDRPLRALVRAWFPVILGALLLLAATGLLLIASEPGRALFRTVFWVKMGLIVVATVVTGAQGLATRSRILPRMLAIASLLLWLGVIFAGRWIAYADGWAGASS